jgi:hypothetical protein
MTGRLRFRVGSGVGFKRVVLQRVNPAMNLADSSMGWGGCGSGTGIDPGAKDDTSGAKQAAEKLFI